MEEATVSSSGRTYPDLHDHLRTLEGAGLLVRVSRPINKDTELHPLVRWQFRGGIPEPERKGFLFERVTDSKGRVYALPVAVGVRAASREIYRLGMGWSGRGRSGRSWACPAWRRSRRGSGIRSATGRRSSRRRPGRRFAASISRPVTSTQRRDARTSG